MQFRWKIGLSFLLLSFLTAATGGVGLVFIFRVLDAFGGVPGIAGTDSGGLDALNRSVQEAVEISRAISSNDRVADVLAQRREFVRTVEEFDRTFARIRRGLEDDLFLDRLEQVKQEQSLLAEQTHALVDAMVSELQAEDAYRNTLTESETQWQGIVVILDTATAALEETEAGSPGLVEGLRALARTQHDLIELRLELRRVLALTDAAAVAASRVSVDAMGATVLASLAALRSPVAPPRARDPFAACAEAIVRWQGGLGGETGLVERYRVALSQQGVTDAYSGAIRDKARESLQSLDSVVALGARLSAERGERGFVSAAPTLLIVTVALSTALSILLSLTLSSAITRPVNQLIGAAESVRAGDYTPQLPPGADELGTLRGAFNRMVDEVRRSHADVTALNAGLEQRIRERTAELQEEIERRQTVEDALRQSEARYRTLIRNFPSGIFALVDREERVLAVGGSVLARLGTAPQDILGRRVAEILPPEALAPFRAPLREALGGERRQVEAAAGGLDWNVLLVPTRPTGLGAQDTVTVLALDVTEAREAERVARRRQQQLVEADRLASLGVLAAGVGHEINNPNQAMLLGGELLRKAWPDIRRILDLHRVAGEGFLVGGMDYDEARQGLEEQFRGIVESARRVDVIVQSLREFARRDHEDMSQPVNVNVVLRSALVLLGNVLRKSTDHLHVDLDQDVPPFAGNPQRIEQVVINLVQNACQALTDRGQEIGITTTFRDGHVSIEVRDQGVGIPIADLPRVRDPFFTTKRERGGTGLGLSVSSTIVAEHGGTLEVHSEAGRGTVVRVRFPVSPGDGDRH